MASVTKPSDQVSMRLIVGVLATGMGIVSLFETEFFGYPFVPLAIAATGVGLLGWEIVSRRTAP